MSASQSNDKVVAWTYVASVHVCSGVDQQTDNVRVALLRGERQRGLHCGSVIGSDGNMMESGTRKKLAFTHRLRIQRHEGTSRGLSAKKNGKGRRSFLPPATTT